MSDESNPASQSKKIVIRPNGPYIVKGGVPLVSKTQVVSELGEPLTWQKDGEIPTGEGEYYLCRCGLSDKKPFCDGTHRRKGFNGTETANTSAAAVYKMKLRGGTRIIVEKDPALCMQSGYCGFSDARLSQLVAETHDAKIRALVMAIVDHCPAGALTFRVTPDGPDIEPDLPQQIAVTTEITNAGPLAGPLWVTGSVPIERSNGQPFDPRNRVTLCNCGKSCNKPLCDGTHRVEAEREARLQRIKDQQDTAT